MHRSPEQEASLPNHHHYHLNHNIIRPPPTILPEVLQASGMPTHTIPTENGNLLRRRNRPDETGETGSSWPQSSPEQATVSSP